MEDEGLLLRYWEGTMQMICRSECSKDSTHFTNRVMVRVKLLYCVHPVIKSS